ncbi:MAG: alpha/beta hydrolase family protein [Promethearchaeota archaeon]
MTIFGIIGSFLGGIVVDQLQRLLLKGYRIRRIEKKKLHWIQSNQINRISEKIVMDDGLQLQGYIYSSDVTSEIAPSILFFHGMGGFAQDLNFEQLLSSLCLSGFRVFAYDFRASGNSRLEKEPHILRKLSGALINRIANDVPIAFEWMYKHEGVDINQLYAIGASFGGNMVLSRLLNEERVKKIVGICAPYDFRKVFEDNFKNGTLMSKILYKSIIRKVPDEESFLKSVYAESPSQYIKKELSNKGIYNKKIFLTQCRNDEVIPFEDNFLKLKKSMQISDENCLIFEKGGHEFAGYISPLVSRILYWLK